MTVLRVDASIQGDRSASSALADLVLEHFTAVRPDEQVVRRHLGAEPLPSDAWPLAVGGNFTPEDQRSEQQRAAVELARTVADELRSADAAVLALPLYNWGVSQHVKAWFDLAIAGAEQGARLLDGTPVVALVTRGGSYAPARRRRAGTTAPTTCAGSSSTSGAPTSPSSSASSPWPASTPRWTSSSSSARCCARRPRRPRPTPGPPWPAAPPEPRHGRPALAAYPVARAAAIARVCSGEEPQHAPMTSMPRSRSSRACSAIASGPTV
ncbi:FMN-dependent NADH-azoreductase [Phycicoccus sp. HDW14]|uniref:FMN-dependent NADH-azoreductase n=1 Tax=Phycicoccus sp. HDW14 TaxID=2714941 RepID=UPI001F0D6747|nr:NAD(P)H-dependent oxidoreductase [Phycicoccus sp. HDW14]